MFQTGTFDGVAAYLETFFLRHITCTDRAREIPKHISVQGQVNENNTHNYNFYDICT